MNASKLLRCLLLIGLAGCQQFDLRLQSPDDPESESDAEEFKTTITTPLIGDYTSIAGLNLVTLEGVGLVTGLDGTGGDPAPSQYRTILMDDMKKRGVRNPNEILRNPSTALVIIRAYQPPLIRKGDTFDVEIRLPQSSGATSLAGGYLLPMYLSERAYVPGRGVPLEGDIVAKAQGPVLISTLQNSDASNAGVLRRGKILGGATSKQDRHLVMYLRNDFKSIRNAKRIADRIGDRFHGYDKYGIKIPLADPKTDQELELRVQDRYRDNYPRYLQVIRSIAFRETAVARRVRIEKLRDQLLEPATSSKSALELEAIGDEAIPILKAGLNSPSLEVRFHAAEALAYLEDPSGVEVLAESAANERAFRVFALAAMSTLDVAESQVLLKNLLNETSAETRYGAFRALWTIDKYDPDIRGELLNESYLLHTLDTEGTPMVHVTRHAKSEIVLFGADQRLETPIALRAGNGILITASAGADTVSISRFAVDEPDQRRQVSTRVADVIRAVSELGGTYPDVSQMLAEADKQKNLAGRLAIDTLPQAGRVYVRPEQDSSGTEGRRKRARVGHSNLNPNLFPTVDPSDDDASPSSDSDDMKPRTRDATDDVDDEDDDGTASLADVRKSDESDEKTDLKRQLDFLGIFKKVR